MTATKSRFIAALWPRSNWELKDLVWLDVLEQTEPFTVRSKFPLRCRGCGKVHEVRVGALVTGQTKQCNACRVIKGKWYGDDAGRQSQESS